MPTRVIGQNPGLPTLIQLLAGYGAGARETAAANAATRTRSNEMLGRGIGEGIGNLFQVPAQLAQQERTMGMEFKQKLALQKAALDNAMQVEQVRSQGNVYEQAAQDFQKRWGVPYTAVIEQARAAGFQVPGMSAFGQSSPQAAPGEFGVSMPGQEMSQTFPSPPAQAPSPGVALPLANPAMTQEYQQAKKELSKWEAAAATERLKPMPSRSHPLYGQAADERAQTLNTLTQRIAGAREVLGKYQEPKPPATEQELISSGALIPLQGGRLFYQDPDGKKHVTAPTKMQEADIEYETHMLDGTVRKSKAGSMVEIKPGIYQITDKSGNVSGWNEPSVKEGKGDKPIFDATDILKVQKDLATKDKDNNPILASPKKPLDIWLRRRFRHSKRS